MSMIAKNRVHSTWTPLNDEVTNNKIFEERANLVKKWFLKWSDDQRKRLFEELVSVGKRRQLEYARDLIDRRVPCDKDDFTRFLPRVFSLYIFSFLDASSLCRCAQVCWYWRYLTELDQLWMPKCLHFGWFLSFTPSPYENGVWKRHFIEQFTVIRAILPKKLPTEMKKLKLDSKDNEKSWKDKRSGPAPWRGSDPVPKDTWRFNYLNNDEVLEKVAKYRNKKAYGLLTDEILKNARSKVNSGSNTLNALTRSLSLTRLINTSGGETGRPKWARTETKSSSQMINSEAMIENGVPGKITRPRPISSPPRRAMKRSSRPATAQTAREVPSTEIFPQMPWKLPDHADTEDGTKK